MRAARRSREDRGHDTQMEDRVSVDDLIKLAERWRQEAKAMLEALAMQPPLGAPVKAKEQDQQQAG